MVLIKSTENQFVEFSILRDSFTDPDGITIGPVVLFLDEDDPKAKELFDDPDLVEEEDFEVNDEDYGISPFDENMEWLFISLKVKSKKASWACIDPALTVGEVKQLIAWFTTLSQGNNPTNSEMSFSEPNLVFELLEDCNSRKKIRIHFDMECAPKYLTEGEHDNEEYFLDCYFTNEELAELAISLFKELTGVK